jgi:hypothetical protein
VSATSPTYMSGAQRRWAPPLVVESVRALLAIHGSVRIAGQRRRDALQVPQEISELGVGDRRGHCLAPGGGRRSVTIALPVRLLPNFDWVRPNRRPYSFGPLFLSSLFTIETNTNSWTGSLVVWVPCRAGTCPLRQDC